MSIDCFDPKNFPYDLVESALGYEFKDKKLLLTAFTLKTFTNENPTFLNNDGLEFLGDSVLSMIVSESLFTFSGTAAQFTKEKQCIVSTIPLSFIVEKLGFYNFLIMGKGDRKTFLVDVNRNTLENLFEAIVGAIYIDGGYEAAKTFVSDKLLSDKVAQSLFVDYISFVKEYCEKHKLKDPEYRVKKLSDSPVVHSAEIYINDNFMGCAQYPGTEKYSKQLAAKKAWDKLKSEV